MPPAPPLQPEEPARPVNVSSDFTVPPPPLPAETEDHGWRPRQPGEPLQLPPAGAVVYVKVTAVVSPELFYVVMPFGTRSAQLVNADCEY